MKRAIVSLFALFALSIPVTAEAGVVLKLSDVSSLDISFRFQALALHDDEVDFNVKRARLRVKGSLTPRVKVVLQSEVSKEAGMKLIDAFAVFDLGEGLQLIAGQHEVPSSRMSIANSATLLALEYPGLVNKSLVWGARGAYRFSTATYGDSGLRGPTQVRDTGLTLLGEHSFTKTHHLKYFVNISDGLSDDERVMSRVQFNFGDPEKGYYTVQNSLGARRTFAVGGGYDFQRDVTFPDLLTGDYEYRNADLFLEQPLRRGYVVVDASWHHLSLSGVRPETEGDGFYVTAGFLLPNRRWQPWVYHEKWSADDSHGTYQTMRVGVSRFFDGHRANLKLGIERFRSQGGEVTSLALGLFTDF